MCMSQKGSTLSSHQVYLRWIHTGNCKTLGIAMGLQTNVSSQWSQQSKLMLCLLSSHRKKARTRPTCVLWTPDTPHRWASYQSGNTVSALRHVVHTFRLLWRAWRERGKSPDTPDHPVWPPGSAPGSFWWNSSCWTPGRTKRSGVKEAGSSLHPNTKSVLLCLQRALHHPNLLHSWGTKLDIHRYLLINVQLT